MKNHVDFYVNDYSDERKQCRCKICGHEFEIIEDVNICPDFKHETLRDELVDEYGDYAWCE